MKINEQMIYASINIKTLTVEKCSNPEGNKMFIKDFYNKFLSPTRLGGMEDNYSYDAFLNLILEYDNTSMLFYSKDGQIVYSFIVNDFDTNEDIVYLSVEKITGEQQSSFQVKDALTGLLTRANIEQTITNLIKSSPDEIFGLFIVDLNNFKSVNDCYGHRIGDDCLRKFSITLSEIVPEYILGRYGGDEFVVFIRDATEEKMCSVANKLLDISIPFRINNINKIIDCCAGASMMEGNETSFSILLEKADKELYYVKNQGKRCVSLDGKTIAERKEAKFRSIKETLNRKGSLLFKQEMSFYRTLNYMVTLGIMLVLSVCVFGAIRYLNRTIENETLNETHRTMSMISEQIEYNIENNIYLWIDRLSSYDTAINDSQDTQEIQDDYTYLFEIIGDNHSFDSVCLLTDSGEMLFSNGLRYNIAQTHFAEKLNIENKSYISTLSINGVGDVISIGVPFFGKNNLYNDIRDNITAICGLFTMESSQEILHTTAFESKAMVSVYKSDGFGITHSSVDGYDFSFVNSNIYNLIERSNDSSEVDLNKESFASGNIGSFSLQHNEKDYLCFYNKLSLNIDDFEFDEWRIVISVPEEVVFEYITATFDTIAIIIGSSFISLLVFGFIMITIINNRNLVIKTYNYIDTLTGGINLKRFEIDAESLLNSKRHYCMIYVNMVKFKYFNYQFGKVAGDDLIAELYSLLEKHLEDNELVGRSYADRFCMMLQYNGSEMLHQRLNDIISDITDFIGEKYEINAFIRCGVHIPNNGISNVMLALDKARMALSNDTNDYLLQPICYFSDFMYKTDVELNDLEQKAELALKENDFIVYYQAKRDIKENKWIGCEALVRWLDPVDGLISPGKFITIFEKNGFIVKLDLYVFEEICKSLRALLDANEKVLPVSVNLSKKHLNRANFMKNYRDIIKKYNIPKNYIEFEITELTLLENDELLRTTISEIHQMGCLCSIDDFGSGYSSLTMIRDFDFDIVKLDRQLFMGKNGFDDECKNVVNAIVKLCEVMNKKVIAEGIETEEQVEFLKSINCNEVQGFYFAKPVPLESYLDLIEND